ncbi:hypothetical protein CDO11_00270 [Xanthomonas oryzae pv. oryzae]|uniref:ISXo8 transposase n=1 Tax=Xanthomonas oryzae pv. oryzae (strain KACC10331 / KXO85) TaxID=291331 RepID=Q5H6N9_XANOR|nr:putative ISXo8 transposase [Xanthomonas oryzae pv. oryzae KACC 10331]AWK20348.1 hypothetical protein B9W05_18835 [Xanthomonas oryzae pv. oryzae]AXI15974.1 hypothetical protein CDO19_00275 [Xanthomonas oryzae pv. oryzae]AXI19925.1 hypothetical protein CDO11_00270 [Xanthomonas oryzae pv. oryzae]BAE66805.1 ISXo8 transposase [Xanthomonas oryzae pv. oryzae MAFF 311018]
MRDSAHAPISVHEVAQSLPARTYRQVSWRQGSDATLSSRFAAVRVRAAHNRQAHDEQWLLIEWPPGESEPRHYWFSTRPKQTPVKTLVATAQGRWRIERDYQELKSELGLHLRFPHISSCEIKHLLHQGVEEGARMGHASR